MKVKTRVAIDNQSLKTNGLEGVVTALNAKKTAATVKLFNGKTVTVNVNNLYPLESPSPGQQDSHEKATVGKINPTRENLYFALYLDSTSVKNALIDGDFSLIDLDFLSIFRGISIADAQENHKPQIEDWFDGGYEVLIWNNDDMHLLTKQIVSIKIK
jgi:hypothetical protein